MIDVDTPQAGVGIGDIDNGCSPGSANPNYNLGVDTNGELSHQGARERFFEHFQGGQAVERGRRLAQWLEAAPVVDGKLDFRDLPDDLNLRSKMRVSDHEDEEFDLKGSVDPDERTPLSVQRLCIASFFVKDLGNLSSKSIFRSTSQSARTRIDEQKMEDEGVFVSAVAASLSLMPAVIANAPYEIDSFPFEALGIKIDEIPYEHMMPILVALRSMPADTDADIVRRQHVAEVILRESGRTIDGPVTQWATDARIDAQSHLDYKINHRIEADRIKAQEEESDKIFRAVADDAKANFLANFYRDMNGSVINISLEKLLSANIRAAIEEQSVHMKVGGYNEVFYMLEELHAQTTDAGIRREVLATAFGIIEGMVSWPESNTNPHSNDPDGSMYMQYVRNIAIRALRLFGQGHASAILNGDEIGNEEQQQFARHLNGLKTQIKGLEEMATAPQGWDRGTKSRALAIVNHRKPRINAILSARYTADVTPKDMGLESAD